MSLFKKFSGLAAILALGTLAWVWHQPRSARDCAPSDSACLRKVAEYLIAESLASDLPITHYGETDVAGRLLATEGTIDLSAQGDRLAALGFGSHVFGSVFSNYFYALTDPSYPFDIPGAIVAGTGPQDTNLEVYLTAAFRLTLRDSARRAEALALWDRHFDALANAAHRPDETVDFVFSWLARHDPVLFAEYLRRPAHPFSLVTGPRGPSIFFRTAAWHCREKRLGDGPPGS